jgi:O-antigen ligase
MRTGSNSTQAGGFDRALLYAILLAMTLLTVLAKFHGSDDEAPANSPVAEVTWSLLYAAVLVRLLAMREALVPLLAGTPALAGYVLLMFASFIWSVAPSISFVDSIELIGSTAIAYYVAARFSLEQFLRIAVAVLVIDAVLSLGLVFLAPGHGRMDYGFGAWIGAFPDKNSLGAAMSLAVLALIPLVAAARGWRLVPVLAAMGLCLTLLVGSNSATAFADCTVAAAVSVAALCWRSPRIGTFSAILTVLVVVFGGLAALVFGITFDSVTGLLGRSASLTGRTDFWPYLQQAIADRPLFGFGYNAFFQSFTGSQYLSTYVVEAGGWSPYHAHNSFLQACLDGGYVGAAFLIVSLLAGIWGSFVYLVRERSSVAIWPLSIFTYLIVGSFTETYLGRFNTLEWMVFVAALLYPLRRSPEPALFFPNKSRVIA